MTVVKSMLYEMVKIKGGRMAIIVDFLGLDAYIVDVGVSPEE